jgi:hypothetical protein
VLREKKFNQATSMLLGYRLYVQEQLSIRTSRNKKKALKRRSR